MRTLRSTLLVVLAVAGTAPVFAQDEAGSMAILKQWYTRVQDNVTKAAEQMPEEHYAYQPTPEVRAFGQIVAHVANAQFMICSAAMGEESPSTVNIEETATTKAAIQEALAQSNAYCNKAYEMSDEAASTVISFFGMEQPALSALMLNYGHAYEHYGNLVTYMRLKGLVPPSSQRG